MKNIYFRSQPRVDEYFKTKAYDDAFGLMLVEEIEPRGLEEALRDIYRAPEVQAINVRDSISAGIRKIDYLSEL